MNDETRGERETWAYFASWRNGQIDLGATAGALPVSDRHAGQLIMDERPGEIFYVPGSAKTWFIWDKKCLGRDTSSYIGRLVTDYADRVLELLRRCRAQAAAEVVLRMDGATEAQMRETQRQAWAPFEPAEKYHHRLRSRAGMSSLTGYMAESLAGTDESALADRWPEHLNTGSGVVSLRTGQTFLHDPRWKMTYCLDVAYNPAARCPQFTALFERACGGNLNVAVYLWKVLGYCMLGGNPEQKIFILCGDTASGKSQVLDAVSIVMGQLAHSSPTDLISVCKRHPRVEASITGKRLVTITETSGHNIIDEAQVKRLTGERQMSISPLYAVQESVVPVTATIIQATNEMQTLTNFDPAMQRRIVAIPMGEAVPEEQRVLRLGEKIAAAEAEGILAWLAAGAMAYFADGHLRPPQEVVQYTASYQAEQNTAQEFVSDWCRVLSPGEQAIWNGQGHTMRPMAWDAYRKCTAGGPRLRKHEFFRQLAQIEGVTYNETSRRFEGLVLNPEAMERMGQDD